VPEDAGAEDGEEKGEAWTERGERGIEFAEAHRLIQSAGQTEYEGSGRACDRRHKDSAVVEWIESIIARRRPLRMPRAHMYSIDAPSLETLRKE
jgi:hypothetical protein